MTKISAEDHTRVSAAVREAELSTSGEIVIIVARRSDTYRDVVFAWALLAVFLTLAVLASVPAHWIELLRSAALGWQLRIDHHELFLALLALLAVKFAVAFFIVSLWPVRLALTPRRVKAIRARARAIDYFHVGAERRTKGRTAVLLYVSLDERKVEIVADSAIHSRVSPESWGHAAASLADAMRDGRPGDGMVDAIGQIGALLARHFPPVGDNPNELPDGLIEVD